jgi:hypothetical protein
VDLVAASRRAGGLEGGVELGVELGFAGFLFGGERGDEVVPEFFDLGGAGLAGVLAGLADGVGKVVGLKVALEVGELVLGAVPFAQEGGGGVQVIGVARNRGRGAKDFEGGFQG